MNVSLRHLRAFISVAQTGSFTAAANALLLSQSALTKTIRELEQEVELPLFERTTRRVSLTENGRAFYPVAKRLLNDLDSSLDELRARALGSTGVVSVASGLAFASTVFPPVIAELNKRYPNIHINVVDDTSGGVIQRIETGEVDLGIGSYVGSAQNILSIRSLLVARLGVLFPPDYPGVPTRVTGDDLKNLPVLCDAPDSSIAAALRRYIPEYWETVVRRVVVTNLDLQLSMIRSGVGVCIVSALAASHPSAKGMPFRLIESPELQREIYVFTRKQLPVSPAASAFLSVMGEVLAKMAFGQGVTVGPYVDIDTTGL
jgi:DNA-binding transcriptional LysR family regulator